MKNAVGSLALQWQDRPEGAAAEYRAFLAAQRRCRRLRLAAEPTVASGAIRKDRPGGVAHIGLALAKADGIRPTGSVA